MATTTTNTFIWNDIGQQLTCTPVHMTWNYAGNVTTLDFSLTNIDVPRLAQPASSTAGSGTTVTTTNTFRGDWGTTVAFWNRAIPSGTSGSLAQFQILIASSVSASGQSYDYSKLAAPQGWYQVIASSSAGDISKRTSSFYVWNGTDTSCIVSAVPSSIVSQTSSQSSSSAPISTSSTPSVKSKASSYKTGGIVVAILVVVLAVVLTAWCTIRRRRRRRREVNNQSPNSTTADTGVRPFPVHEKNDQSPPERTSDLQSNSRDHLSAPAITSEAHPESHAPRTPHGSNPNLAIRVAELEEELRRVRAEANPPDYVTEAGESYEQRVRAWIEGR